MLTGDLVLQSANAPGTATFSLIAPTSGRVSFVSGCGAGQVFYYAHDGVNWERGIGTVTAGSPDTLSRDTVVDNSLNTTAKINFSSTVSLYTDVLAERVISASADNSTIPAAGRTLSALGAGTAADHAIRWDQAGEILVGKYSVSGGAIVVPFPNATDLYRIDFSGLILPTTAAPIYFRVCVDGTGTNFLTGATEYKTENWQTNGTPASSVATSTTTYAAITQAMAVSATTHGHLDIVPANRQWRGQMCGTTGTVLSQDFPSGNWTTSGLTHMQISGVASSLSAGTARLVRKA